jgi:hypothetical protein
MRGPVSEAHAALAPAPKGVFTDAGLPEIAETDEALQSRLA